MSSCTINTSTREIRISDGFSANIAAGSTIKINIGLIRNPTDQANTNSLTLISYTDSAFLYKID